MMVSPVPAIRMGISLRGAELSRPSLRSIRGRAALLAGGADLGGVLERRRQALERARSSTDQRLRALDIWVEMTDCGPDVVVRGVESQLIAGLVASIGPVEDIARLFNELEAVVRDAGARASRPPGALVPLRRGAGHVEVEIFVPVTRAVNAGRVVSRRLPAARVAAATHRGPYEGRSALRNALEEWVDAAGYHASDRVRLVYLQFGADPELDLPEPYLTRRSIDYFTEIQLPLLGPESGLPAG
jgi:effector-binding domain-containing protein